MSAHIQHRNNQPCTVTKLGRLLCRCYVKDYLIKYSMEINCNYLSAVDLVYINACVCMYICVL